jgi:hypothetical protein
MADKNSLFVKSPTGEIGQIPRDFAQDAYAAGFEPVSSEEVKAFQDQQIYGEGLENELKAFGAGAARTATFGLSDQFLTKTGLAKPETLKGLEEYNPVASTLGEVAGVAGALLAPELAGPAAALNPVKAVSRIGTAITEGAAPTVGRAVSRIASAETSPIAHKILEKAGATALGSAVEGAAFGLGQSVSEDALGDPNALGEKLFSNVGYGAFFGAGLGGALGATAGAMESTFPKFFTPDQKMRLAQGDFETAIKAEVPTAQQKGILDGLRELKDNASEIKAAADDIGAPVLESQISASKLVQRADDALLNGPPTLAAMSRQNLAQKGWDAAENTVKGTLDDGTSKSAAELGNELKESLTKKIQTEASPIEEMYGYLKENMADIPINTRGINQVSNNIRNLEGVSLSPSSPQYKFANGIADEITNLKTVDEIRQYKSIIRQNQDPSLRYIRGRILEKLDDLEERSIIRFAEENSKSLPTSDRILSLINQHAETKKAYAVFRGKMENLGAVLGKKKIYGKQDFLDFIDDLTPEKLSNRLFAKNNSEFLKFFSENFPEEMQAVRQYQKGLIADKATKDGVLNIRTVFREIEKLPKETQELLFTPEQLKKLNSARVYVDSYPKNFNPSGTSHEMALRQYFERGPMGAILANARDYGLEKFIKLAVNADESSQAFAQQVGILAQIERAANSTMRSIHTGSKAVFKTTQEGQGFFYSKIRPQDEREYEKTEKQIQQFVANPEVLLNKLQESVAPIVAVAPKTSQGIQGTASLATAFLKSKIPAMPAPKILSRPYQPSKAELSKFNKYFSIIERPTSVFDQIQSGTLTAEHMEALTVVYPALLRQMQEQVLNDLSEFAAKKNKDPLPYGKKFALSMFLGTDLDDTLSAQSIQANQMSYQMTLQQDDQMPGPVKPTVGGMKELSLSSNAMTPSQRTSQRDLNS